jgi:hypothetical protein
MSHQDDLISEDIQAYLAQHERKELLRFLTCGNVDDGKSTLIGRLLHDSKMIYEDHLEAITKDSKKVGTTGEDIDLALLVDVCRLSASRASPSTWRTAISAPPSASSSSPTRPAMSSTPATWPPEPPPATWRSS